MFPGKRSPVSDMIDEKHLGGYLTLGGHPYPCCRVPLKGDLPSVTPPVPSLLVTWVSSDCRLAHFGGTWDTYRTWQHDHAQSTGQLSSLGDAHSDDSAYIPRNLAS